MDLIISAELIYMDGKSYPHGNYQMGKEVTIPISSVTYAEDFEVYLRINPKEFHRCTKLALSCGLNVIIDIKYEALKQLLWSAYSPVVVSPKP